MVSESYVERKLETLYEKRDALAAQIDKAYVRGSISQYLALEERYKQLSLMIEQLSSQTKRPTFAH